MSDKSIFQDSNGDQSSKRIAGTAVLAAGACLLLAVGIVAMFYLVKDSETALDAGKALITAGAALLGIGVVEWFGGKK